MSVPLKALAYLLDKEYLLILKIPIHPASEITSCPDGIKDAHSQKKRKINTEKRKVPLQRSKT
jgi:hypothetical protein